MFSWKNLVLFLTFVLCVNAASAQQMVLVKISSGTGFFINRDGDVVTNAHVVRNCQSISVHTPQGERKAVVQAMDVARDLAVLWVAGGVDEIAPLRWNVADLKVGDSVTVVGYPGHEGVEGHYSTKKTTITALNGPAGEPSWLQLGPVVELGNSGGPVLDSAGNVIAVVNAKSKIYRMEAHQTTPPSPDQLVAESGVAITLSALQDFLRAHNVGYYQAASGLVAYADDVITQRALHFIVPIRCVVGPAD